MKKILVFTDSHGQFKNIYNMVLKEEPDIIICAGDYSDDAFELSSVFENKKFYIVNGNCDFFNRTYRDDEIFIIENKKFFLTHGHVYSVKSDLNKIKQKSKELKIDVSIFGHTHKSFISYEDDFILYNPGAAKDGYYGIIIINENNLEIKTKNIIVY